MAGPSKRRRNINMRFTDEEMEAIWRQMRPGETQTATVRRLLALDSLETPEPEPEPPEPQRELLPRFTPH